MSGEGMFKSFRRGQGRSFVPPGQPDGFSPKGFPEILAAANAIPGMMSDMSVQIFDTLFDLQQRNGIVGPMLEIGVYMGKSASVLAAHARPSERVVLVDVHKHFDEAIEKAHLAACDFQLMPSERFRADFRDYGALKRACRFVHIDSSHQYRATLGELKIVDELLADGGIAVFDDFVNLDYSQNMAAIFRYIFTADTDLRLFLITNEKAYVCRESALAFYGGFALEGLTEAMRQRGNDKVLIARTDNDPDFRPIYLRARLPGEEGDRFGLNIYEAYYKAF
jgi:predicted O-methyltransferase YrrM